MNQETIHEQGIEIYLKRLGKGRSFLCLQEIVPIREQEAFVN